MRGLDPTQDMALSTNLEQRHHAGNSGIAQAKMATRIATE
jgi:hypothetical protein